MATSEVIKPLKNHPTSALPPGSLIHAVLMATCSHAPDLRIIKSMSDPMGEDLRFRVETDMFQHSDGKGWMFRPTDEVDVHLSLPPDVGDTVVAIIVESERFGLFKLLEKNGDIELYNLVDDQQYDHSELLVVGYVSDLYHHERRAA